MSNPVNRDFISLVDQTKKTRNIFDQDIADVLGIKRTTIISIRRGRTNASIDLISKLLAGYPELEEQDFESKKLLRLANKENTEDKTQNRIEELEKENERLAQEIIKHMESMDFQKEANKDLRNTVNRLLTLLEKHERGELTDEELEEEKRREG